MTIVENLRWPLILLATIGSSLTGGIFFAFSTFIMQALAKWQQPYWRSLCIIEQN